MVTARTRQMMWILPLALYALFWWRTRYHLTSMPFRILDWVAPVVLLGAWAVTRWRRGEPWPFTTLDRPLLLLVLITSLAAVFSVNVRSSLRGTWEMLIGLAILWSAVDVIRRGWGHRLWNTLYLLSAVVLVVSGIEFLAWYLGWPLLPEFQQGWPAIGGLANPIPPHLHRLGETLNLPATTLSAFVALLVPPAITTLAGTRLRDVRVGMLLWLATAVVVEILAFSRGGFLALGVSLSVLVAGSTRTPWFRRRWSMSMSTRWRPLLAGVTPVVLMAGLGAGFWLAVQFGEHTAGDAIRWDLWRSAVEMFRDHPLTGVGPAAYGTALRIYREPLVACEHCISAHNLGLHMAAETGVPGLLATIAVLVALTRAWWRRWQLEVPGSHHWWRILGLGAALAGLGAQSMVDLYIESAVVLPALLFVALILAPPPSPARLRRRLGHWSWAATVSILLLGAVYFAWDEWGYVQFARSLTWGHRGDTDQALPLVEQARGHDPDMGLYACYAGNLHDSQQDLATAIERYEECVTAPLVPGWLDQLNLGVLLWQDGQQTRALTVARATTDVTPLEWLPWLNRGLWAETMGNLEEAAEAYGWVLAVDPDLAGSRFWQEGRRPDLWNAALDAGQEAATLLDKELPPWKWQVLLAAGRADVAAADCLAWLDAHPQDFEAMAWLGEAVLETGQPDQAVEWLDQALSGRPDLPRAYLARGRALIVLGHYTKAERDLRTSLFLEPTEQVHLELARLARRTGDEETALQEYSRALRSLSFTQQYNPVLYDRIGWPAPLPRMARIGYRWDGETALEWGAWLEQRGDPVAAGKVYDRALILDPYLDDLFPAPGGTTDGG